ncbi:hypothetical protein CPB84DRAFT_1844655 [Gymnopilus junonius]|uniref:Uncharacterized protein n=1 Tax=Gymnopilus junonius TaxID=109634 RepID=A0A9P5NVL5_GYMJU|nr:hypothetical protein CPB84DRAFT_1844655 [Gymnopilus junonius]
MDVTETLKSPFHLATMLANDSYDMPMLDYPTDLDIQMHPSTSDQWLQDEAKMEEDGAYPSKSDFEVDMEPSADDPNAEYDMLDDEQIRESGADVFDVEVYDVSSAQSPAMLNFDIPYEQAQPGLASFQRIHSSHDLHEDPLSIPSNFMPEQSDSQVLESFAGDAVFREDNETIAYGASPEVIEGLIPPSAESEVTLQEHYEFHDSRENNEVFLPSDNHSEDPVEHYPTSDEVIIPTDEQEPQHAERHTSRDESVSRSDDQAGVLSQDAISETVVVASSSTRTVEVVQGLHVVTSGLENKTSQDNSEQEQSLEQQDEGSGEQEHRSEVPVEIEPAPTHISGDPHEISEGVYIDPPPPVLLTLASEGQCHFCLFNQVQDHEANSEGDTTHQVLLHQLPTLYYEPLSTVFDALRQELSVKSVFHLADSELVLEAIDLQLIVSEDNVYAVDVSLHDLNVLHDGSGIGGLLRMRLSAVTPRFITRYQYLQEQVSRFHLEQLSGEALTGPTVAEASLEVPPETDRLPEPDADAKGNLNQSIKAAKSDAPDGAINNNTDPSQGLSRILVIESPDGPLSPSTSGLDHSEETDGDSLHDDAESVQPILQNMAQSGDTSSGNNFTATDQSSNVEEEHLTVDDYSDSHTEDGTIPLETLEASHQGDDTYTDVDHISLPQVAPSEDVFAHGEDGIEQGPEEASVDAAQEVGYHSDRVTSSASRASPASQERATLGADVDGIIRDYGEEVVYPSNVEVEGATDEAAAFRLFSENKGQEEPNESDIDNEGRLTLLAEPEPDIPDEKYWEDDQDGDGEYDTTWEEGHEKSLSQSNHSSVTLSSTASKRSFDEFESAGDLYDEDTGHWSPPSSPDPKRSRIQ